MAGKVIICGPGQLGVLSGAQYSAWLDLHGYRQLTVLPNPQNPPIARPSTPPIAPKRPGDDGR